MVYKKHVKNIFFYSQSDQINRHTIVGFLDSLDLLALGKKIKVKLVSPITKEEIGKAIPKLNTNKSTGTDGFAPELYKSMKAGPFAGVLF